MVSCLNHKGEVFVQNWAHEALTESPAGLEEAEARVKEFNCKESFGPKAKN